jgi:hypothetical protein
MDDKIKEKAEDKRRKQLIFRAMGTAIFFFLRIKVPSYA